MGIKRFLNGGISAGEMVEDSEDPWPNRILPLPQHLKSKCSGTPKVALRASQGGPRGNRKLATLT